MHRSSSASTFRSHAPAFPRFPLSLVLAWRFSPPSPHWPAAARTRPAAPPPRRARTRASRGLHGTTTGSASVIAAPGSTGVAITVDTGATLATNATQALLVRDGSSITNNGRSRCRAGIGSARAAMVATGNDNTMTNNGAIRTTSGAHLGHAGDVEQQHAHAHHQQRQHHDHGGSSHGISTLGPGNTVFNNGTIASAAPRPRASTCRAATSPPTCW
jgi:hypothetical protein